MKLTIKQHGQADIVVDIHEDMVIDLDGQETAEETKETESLRLEVGEFYRTGRDTLLLCVAHTKCESYPAVLMSLPTAETFFTDEFEYTIGGKYFDNEDHEMDIVEHIPYDEIRRQYNQATHGSIEEASLYLAHCIRESVK